MSFSLVNADTSTQANNIEDIIKLVDFINLIRNQRETYRLKVWYKYPTNVAIEDAMYVGAISIEELSAIANAGQKVPMVFKSRTLVTDIVIDQAYSSYRQMQVSLTDDEITV